jgi:hypothetical protein
MSSAFVKEGESPLLKDVAPNLHALLFYLRRENGGVAIHWTKNYFSEKHQQEVYEMSDGLTYMVQDQHWKVLLD